MLTNLFLGQTSEEKLYVEDVFSTYLYTGTGSDFYINNGIDVNGKGGLYLIKSRSQDATGNPTGGAGRWFAASKESSTSGETAFYSGACATTSAATGVTAPTWFTSSGQLVSGGAINTSSATYASWTFRKAPKFFDVVTYTGNGAGQGVRAISHSLGVSPGMIIIKRTDSSSAWAVWHRYAGVTNQDVSGLSLNATTAAQGYPNGTTALMNASSFDPANIYGADLVSCNANGASYVAYLFAHDTTADGVIQCGSFTTDSSGNVGTINLGWEPQYILCKVSSATQGWFVFDTMRGWTASGNTFGVQPNASSAELDYSGGTNYFIPTATGFTGAGNFFGTNATVIYLAIRRGPMRVPTDATKVFSPITATGSAGTVLTTGFVIDSQWKAKRAATDALNTSVDDRLRGVSTRTSSSGNYLITSGTAAEATANATTKAWSNTGFQIPSYFDTYYNTIYLSFSRAPGFFDVVCYTGNSVTNQQITHGLKSTPELIIAKKRNGTSNWVVYSAQTGINGFLYIDGNSGLVSYSGSWGNVVPTDTTFNVNSLDLGVTGSVVAYLFASCPGVSKVFSFTGNGSSQNIDCGFTNGARFVMIKRTDSTGNWLVADTARGIIAANDPSLALNSTAAETTTVDWLDPLSSGFTVVQETTNNANVNGATYIGIAIA